MSKILNCLLSSIIIFLLCFIWIVYCLKDRTIAFALSAIVTLASGYLIWKSLSRFEQGKKLKQTKKSNVAKLSEYLRFNENNAELFADMLRYYRFEVTPVDYDNLIVSKNDSTSYVALRFAKDSVTKDELCKAVVSAKRAKCSKLYVFSNKIDSATVNLAEKYLHTVTVDIANTYALLDNCEKLPSLPKSAQRKSSVIASYAFNRRRFGLYLLSCLFMLAVSVVAYFPWYTMGWATVNFILAMYSLLNTRYNTPPTNITLD
ncbi:MAG: hypothetical protein J1G02_01140 [Clostridiales bacterium]|nr:hypothetical protein [Clostridiales bacterium]